MVVFQPIRHRVPGEKPPLIDVFAGPDLSDKRIGYIGVRDKTFTAWDDSHRFSVSDLREIADEMDKG